MSDQRKYTLSVHKSSDSNKGERYQLKVTDDLGHDVTPDFANSSSATQKAHKMTRAEYDKFIRNGGEMTVCNYCSDRQELKDKITALENDESLDPATKSRELNRLRIEEGDLDKGFKANMDSVMGKDWTDAATEDYLENSNVQPAINLDPTSERVPTEIPDTDGDGIPDFQDENPETPDEVPPDGEYSFNGYHVTLSETDKQLIKSGSFPEVVKNESQYVPKYAKIANACDIESSIQSSKTNTHIIFGRDRTGIKHPLLEGAEKSEANNSSGYGNHMAAGAIDIVVGRGAPFPLGEMKTGPLFVTTEIPKNLDLPNIGPGPADKQKPHPRYMMDAARIYISQKTDADINFGITDFKYEDVFDSSRTRISKDQATINPGIKGKIMPRSAIVAKSDEVRIISRHNIKLVTGGARKKGDSKPTIDGRWNSQGGRIQTIEGIELLAGNGYDAFGEVNRPQPFVLGKNHLDAQDGLIGLLHDLAAIIEALLMTQMEFNGFVMTHFHLSPLFGLPTTFSPILPVIGIKTMIDHIVRAYLGIIFFRMNLTTYKMNFLTPTSKTYVLSRYNRTN